MYKLPRLLMISITLAVLVCGCVQTPKPPAPRQDLIVPQTAPAEPQAPWIGAPATPQASTEPATTEPSSQPATRPSRPPVTTQPAGPKPPHTQPVQTRPAVSPSKGPATRPAIPPATRPSLPLPPAPPSPPKAERPAPPVAPMEDLPANPAVDQVLDALERRGKTLREFTAIVGLTDGDPFVGDLSTRTGRMIFQKIGQDEGRLRVIFDQRLNGKVAQREDSEYMLDNGWLTERNYKRKTQTRREIVKPGEKLNLLSLGQGPFPLPIGQKKQDVLDMFKVSIQPLTGEESKDKDLSKTVHVTLETKPNTRFSRRFGAIDVWVDRKTHFPVQIHTQAPDESDPHLTRLQNLQINPTAGLKDSDFQLPNIDEQEWSMHTEPYRE